VGLERWPWPRLPACFGLAASAAAPGPPFSIQAAALQRGPVGVQSSGWGAGPGRLAGLLFFFLDSRATSLAGFGDRSGSLCCRRFQGRTRAALRVGRCVGSRPGCATSCPSRGFHFDAVPLAPEGWEAVGRPGLPCTLGLLGLKQAAELCGATTSSLCTNWTRPDRRHRAASASNRGDCSGTRCCCCPPGCPHLVAHSQHRPPGASSRVARRLRCWRVAQGGDGVIVCGAFHPVIPVCCGLSARRGCPRHARLCLPL